MMKRFLFFIIFVLCLYSVSAAPSITSSSNSLTNNQTYTISGSGFGIKNPVAPLSWDDFESGVLNDKLGSAKIGTGWTHQATISGNNCCWGTICQPCTYYSNDISHAGTKSAKNIVDNYGYNFFGWTGQNLEEIYVYYWRYFDPYQSDVSNVCNHKQIYIYSNIPSQGSPQYLLGSTQRVDDVWPIAIQGDCSLTYTDYRGISRPTHVDYNDAVYNSGDTNSWKQWELFIKPDAPSSASNGAEYFWQNGKLLDGVIPYAGSSGQAIPVADRENINLVADSCSYSETLMRDFRIGALVHTKTSDGACSGGRAYNNQPDITYLDDLYVDNTRSRIMICNVATWSAKETNGAHCEIQIPHTTWNDGAIQFTANSGNFISSDSLYLYVVDSTGTANVNGYPVTFGGIIGEYCGDSTCNNGETCSTCSQDCGACPIVCGNGNCETGETCSTCAADCGSCSTSVTQTINLVQGWNLVTLRVNASVTSNTLQSLFVMRYENNQWQTAWGSSSVFNLEPLRVYYVYSTSAKSISITGAALNSDYNYPLQDYNWNMFAVNRTGTFNSIYPEFISFQQELYRINSGFSYTVRNAAGDNLVPGEFYWVNIRSPQTSPVYASQVKSNDFIGGIITFIYNIFN